MSSHANDLGLQLYSVREQLIADAAGTLRAVVDAGYTHVEPMDTAQLSALKDLCDDLGLGIRSSFYNWTAVTDGQELLRAVAPEAVPAESFEEMVEVAARVGVETLVFGYLLPPERTSAADYQRHAERINRAAERVRAAGMQHAYHHHSFEFAPLNADGVCGWDVLMRELDLELTKLEVDVFWAELGGRDPVEFLAAHSENAIAVHLKDVAAKQGVCYDEHAVAPASFRPVGAGRLDVEAILAQCASMDLRYWIVEQDHSPSPLAHVAHSRQFIAELGLIIKN